MQLRPAECLPIRGVCAARPSVCGHRTSHSCGARRSCRACSSYRGRRPRWPPRPTLVPNRWAAKPNAPWAVAAAGTTHTIY
eukprot:352210-Chlamydomonas_euryale.AAC.10